MTGAAGAKARRLLGIAPPRYGDIVRFRVDHHGPFALSDPVYAARFMWITTQYEDGYGGDVVTVVCIVPGGVWNAGDVTYKNPSIFEVVA